MKKTTLWMLFCLLCALPTHANGWDEAKYKQIEQSIRVPQFANKDYVITKFGAKPENSAAKNQQAIQKAIDKCSKKGGGRVVVPEGMVFMTGAIQLKSGVNRKQAAKPAVKDFMIITSHSAALQNILKNEK